MSLVLNIIAFNLVWIVTVTGAADGFIYAGLWALLLSIGIQFRYRVLSIQDLKFAFLVGLIGTSIDALLLAAGLYRFELSSLSLWGLPLWMSVLWLAFATTLRSSLGWLSHRYILASILGALSGSLSYRAGELLGAIDITGTWSAYPFELAVVWAVVTPLAFYLSNNLLMNDASEHPFIMINRETYTTT